MEKKIVLLQLLSMLQQKSDQDHPIKVKDIIQYFDKVHATIITRQTIYKNIKLLNKAGYSIENLGRRGYYYDDRLFEKSEVIFMCHSIISNNIIPLSQSDQLLDKIMGTQSDVFKRQFKNNFNLKNLDKKENKDMFLNVEILSEAINSFKEVNFRYTTFNYDKEIVYKNEKIYHVIPHFILCKDGKMYLIAQDTEYNQQRQYRLDRMVNLQISEKYFIPCKQDAYHYAKNRHYMYAGKMHDVRLKCDNSMLDEVVERFGKDCMIRPMNDDTFIVQTKMTDDAAIFFSCQFIQYTEIIEPTELRVKLTGILKQKLAKYTNDNHEEEK